MLFSQRIRIYANKVIVRITYRLLDTINKKELAKRALIREYISELFKIDFREGQKFLHYDNGGSIKDSVGRIEENDLDWAITRINHAIAEYKGR